MDASDEDSPDERIRSGKKKSDSKGNFSCCIHGTPCRKSSQSKPENQNQQPNNEVIIVITADDFQISGLITHYIQCLLCDSRLLRTRQFPKQLGRLRLMGKTTMRTTKRGRPKITTSVALRRRLPEEAMTPSDRGVVEVDSSFHT
ncbi:unnamed protein product [Haemonchus placei]|uniref:Uncharacterized protein n=1 Tax=Haemonchus placei TaxID=6290 RepID=A0A0N4XA89_HAEPC|nr:unnamed protein product [Haemonchus placei]